MRSHGLRQLVAFLPDGSGADALALARLLDGPPDAGEITVCTVVPQTRMGGDAGHGEPGYGRLVADRVEAAQRAAAEDFAFARLTIRLAPSAATGLLEMADEIDASLMVLGSSRSGAFGRYVVGSVAGALQHASPVPLALAPEGFAVQAPERLSRVSCGYHDTVESQAALDTAVALCRVHQVPLRLVTFLFPEYPALRNLPALVALEEGTQQAVEPAQKRLADVAASVPDDVAVETLVAAGGNIGQAMASPAWWDGEVLVLGSARLGPLSRVFLGSTSLKLLRTCPAPVVAVPRGAALEVGNAE